MPDLRFTVSQAWQNWSARRALHTYHRTWQQIIAEFQGNQGADAFWLTHSANYLLRTGGVHWALDPFSLVTRLGQGKQPDFAKDLACLDLVVLSHIHADHFDPILLSALSSLALTWVVPEFMVSHLSSLCDLSARRIIIPHPGEPLRFGNLTLTPFEGLHFHGRHGVPEMGYLVEFGPQRWLFPGDTRTFDHASLPGFGQLNGLLAHCWLGKKSALFPRADKLAEFTEFYKAFNPQKMVISHLYEWGRDARDLWTMRHFRLVKNRLQASGYQGAVIPARTGSCIQFD